MGVYTMCIKALSLRFQQPRAASHVNRGSYNSCHLPVTVSRQCRATLSGNLEELELKLKQTLQTANGACCRLLSSAVTVTSPLRHTHTQTNTKGLNMQRFLYAT